MSERVEKSDIQASWGDSYQQLHQDNDRSLTSEILERQIYALGGLFQIREQPCVVEIPLDKLSGIKALEIGSGGGGHSTIFKRYGADVTAVEITPQRVASTDRKLKLISSGKGHATQLDAKTCRFPMTVSTSSNLTAFYTLRWTKMSARMKFIVS